SRQETRAICPIFPRVEVPARKPLGEDGLMTLDESIQGMRLQVMRRAAEIGVSAACREAGISRPLFYRWGNRLSRYGLDGLDPRRLKARPGPAPQSPRDRAPIPGRRDRRSDVGSGATGGLRATAVAPARGAQHAAAAVASPWSRHSAS